jgi:autotransporter-associated beta strand protein/T5SS/PEP-CTERM-associated repeat protein
MKTPNTTPTTRASLLTTASSNNRWFASLLASTAVLGSSAFATDWTGDTSTDWNDPLNWTGDAGTVGSNAVVNTNTPNIATISANIPGNPVDIFVGTGGGTNARLDHTAGNAATGGGNWMFVGHNGGTGTYNLADTAGTGGSFTGFGQGTGNLNVGGRLYIGGFQGTGSNGTVNVNTTGTLAIPGELQLGTNQSVGVLNLDAGSVTTGDWTEVGNGAGSSGTLRISGGSLTKNGGGQMIVGANGATGLMTQTGGSVNVNNDIWIANNGGSVGTVNISAGSITNGGWTIIGRSSGNGTVNMTGGSWTKNGGGPFVVAEGNGSVGVLTQSAGDISAGGGEFWVGQAGGASGTYNLSGGTLATNSWVAVGREGGTGVVNMSGGTWTKAVNGALIIGASGPGTFVQTGGTVNVQAGDTWMGENNTATYTLSGTGEYIANYFQVARNGSATGNVNLNGGTLRANQIVGGGGTENVSFNGTQIIARVDQPNFIGGMDFGGATIDAGGLLVDSNGYSLTAPQIFDGSGGVVKSGAGTLVLSGISSYAGNNVLNAGTLVLNAASSGSGSVSTADGTTLGITAPFAGEQLTASAVSLGTSAATTLNLNLGDVAGFNPTNSILDVTGALTVNGPVTVNVAGAKFAVGDIPLVSYNAASLTGAGSFVLGTLPSGVVATLASDPNYFGAGLGAVYLDITSVALPEWDGTNEVVLKLTGDTVAASADITVLNATGIVVGQVVRGAGIPTGATVTAISGLTITLDQVATATGTFVGLDFVVTAGTNEGLWDTTTQNWVDQVTTLSSLYADPNPALFSDLATGPTAVVLNVAVNPSEVTFNNSTRVYSLSGTGSISGSTGLLKQGTAGLTVNNTNAYTGVTRLEGGVTSVATLTNGGVASPLGAATSDPANLVLAGGTLEYTGGAVSIDRGLSIQGASGLVHSSDLTITGALVRTAGGITKTGAGLLTLGNASNAIGAFRINEGSLAFDGSGGPQVNNANGFFMGAGVSVTLPNNTSLNAGGDVNVGDAVGIVSTLTLSGNAVFTTTNRVMTGMNGAGADGAIMVSGSSQFNMTGGWLSVGETGNGSLTVKDGGTFSMTGGDFNITDLNNSTATLNLQDSGTINAPTTYWGKNAGTVGTINIAGGTFNTANDHYVASAGTSSATVTQTGGTVNMNGGYNPIGQNGTAVWNQSAGTVNANGWTILGRDGTGSGTLNISGGVFSQTAVDRPLMVGEFGVGTLTVSGTGEVNSNGNNGLILANEPSGTGLVNLNGGTLTVKRVREGNDGNGGNGGLSTFRFNGGVLKAAVGANLNFLSGLNSAVVDPGGAFIDTNGQTVAIGQALDDGGGDLTKQGAGTLQLNGANSYFGSTTVAAGTLAGTGSLTGPLIVSATGSVNPGITAGTFTAGDSASIAGTYVCELDGANGDSLAVSGGLTLSAGSVLDINELTAATAFVYVIASYSSLTGTFTTVNDLPAGYTLDYNYLGGNQIALVKPLNAYQTWATSFGLDPLTDGAAGADADDDGQSNGLEFALGGSPVSGSDNAKVYHLQEDSADAGAAKELLLTIAVRSGAPAFAGSPSPTTTHDGATYTVQGSTDLATFASAVSVVAPVTTGLPAAPAGYEYRTFSLDGSDGLPSKGFLRVDVTP